MRKRVLAAFLVMFMCFIMTGCGGEFSGLYNDVGLKYVDMINEMSFDEAKEIAKDCGYRFEIKSNSINIFEKDDTITLSFDDDTLSSFSYFSLDKDKSFWISEYTINTREYGTSGSYNDNVYSLADCEKFMFGKTSGINVTKLSLSEKNSTTPSFDQAESSPDLIEPVQTNDKPIIETGVTNLYSDVFKPFCGGMDTLTFEKAKSTVRGLNYTLEITDEDGTFTVTAEDGDKVTASFCWDMNENNTLYQLMYEHGDCYIYASSLAHIQEVHYFVCGADGEKSVNSLADCEKFLFGSSETQEQTYDVKLLYGELLEKRAIGTSLTIKAKIEPSYNNKATVDQNYFNVEDIIKNQGGTRFTQIDYWAVADMTDGSESKVVSFTLSEDVIKKIANNQIAANTLGDYVDELYILPSLQD